MLLFCYHCCDYYQVQGLLDSKADVAISMDSDLMFVSDDVKTLVENYRQNALSK